MSSSNLVGGKRKRKSVPGTNDLLKIGINGHFSPVSEVVCGVPKEHVRGEGSSAETSGKRADDSKLLKAVRSKTSCKQLQNALSMLNA